MKKKVKHFSHLKPFKSACTFYSELDIQRSHLHKKNCVRAHRLHDYERKKCERRICLLVSFKCFCCCRCIQCMGQCKQSFRAAKIKQQIHDVHIPHTTYHISPEHISILHQSCASAVNESTTHFSEHLLYEFS